MINLLVNVSRISEIGRTRVILHIKKRRAFYQYRYLTVLLILRSKVTSLNLLRMGALEHPEEASVSLDRISKGLTRNRKLNFLQGVHFGEY